MKPNAIKKSTQEAVVFPKRFIDDSDDHVAFDFTPLEGVSRRYWKIANDVAVEMSVGEKAAVNAAQLGPAKRAVATGIVARTPALMKENGFQYNGKTFRMDADGVAWYHLLYAARAQLTYPTVIPTKDCDNFEAIADAAEMQTFGGALLAALNGYLDAERALLQQVKDAADFTELEAIVDGRT